MQVRRIAVDQHPARVGKIEVPQQHQGINVRHLNAVRQRELVDDLGVNVVGNRASRLGLATKDGTAADVGFDVGIVRRHVADDGLIGARGSLGTEVGHVADLIDGADYADPP
ncbi:hypothetical protein D9M70_627720 [compost metagenome]